VRPQHPLLLASLIASSPRIVVCRGFILSLSLSLSLSFLSYGVIHLVSGGDTSHMILSVERLVTVSLILKDKLGLWGRAADETLKAVARSPCIPEQRIYDSFPRGRTFQSSHFAS
jgi:hypothetical protein